MLIMLFINTLQLNGVIARQMHISFRDKIVTNYEQSKFYWLISDSSWEFTSDLLLPRFQPRDFFVLLFLRPADSCPFLWHSECWHHRMFWWVGDFVTFVRVTTLWYYCVRECLRMWQSHLPNQAVVPDGKAVSDNQYLVTRGTSSPELGLWRYSFSLSDQ